MGVVSHTLVISYKHISLMDVLNDHFTFNWSLLKDNLHKKYELLQQQLLERLEQQEKKHEEDKEGLQLKIERYC